MAYGQEKTNERDILIQVVSDIRSISGQEFRGGYINKILSGNTISETYVPDTRRQYCQLVDFLSDMLLSNFDEETANAYGVFAESVDELITKKNGGEITDEDFISTKLRLSRKLLQHLFLLLNKKRWLKTKTEIG